MTLPVIFHFDERKAAQAAAWLLRRHGGEMSRFHLIKLLYLADRRALLDDSCPITGDHFLATPHGPVLGRIHDLIKGNGAGNAVWCEFVAPAGESMMRPGDCADTGKLSEYETDILAAVDDEFGALTGQQLKQRTTALPEWADPGPDPASIDPAEILRSAGRAEWEIEEVAQHAEAARSFLSRYGE